MHINYQTTKLTSLDHVLTTETSLENSGVSFLLVQQISTLSLTYSVLDKLNNVKTVIIGMHQRI